MPEELGQHVAQLLFEEIWRGGTIDTTSQVQTLLMMLLGPEVRWRTLAGSF
jgi:RNA 3'-terminal phosphate cyclase